jgi:hypothetical protein
MLSTRQMHAKFADASYSTRIAGLPVVPGPEVSGPGPPASALASKITRTGPGGACHFRSGSAAWPGERARTVQFADLVKQCTGPYSGRLRS